MHRAVWSQDFTPSFQQRPHRGSCVKQERWLLVSQPCCKVKLAFARHLQITDERLRHTWPVHCTEEGWAPHSEFTPWYLPLPGGGGAPLPQAFPHKGHTQEKLLSPRTPGLSVPTTADLPEARKEECASPAQK